MPEFSAAQGGARLVLDETESDVLRQLTGELRALLLGTRDADDPVVERLFPAAYENHEDEAAYRDLIGDDLATEKLRALDVISTSLQDGRTEITLTGEDLHTWLAALTDIRLAIGTRLDVDEATMGAKVRPRDPNAQALGVLHWLGWVQEGLLQTLTGGSV